MATPSLPSFWSSSAKPTLTHVLCTKLFGPRAEVLHNPPQRLVEPADNCQLTLADIPHVSPARDLRAYVEFLNTNFFSPSTATIRSYTAHPQSSLTVEQAEQLVGRGARYLVYKDTASATPSTIQGVISSLPLGRLRRAGSAPTSYEVRLIRDFCVSPTHRAKGVGNTLLQAVLADSRSLGQVCAVFLKEGAPIGRAGPSLYSSTWMYRRYKGRDSAFGASEIPARNVNEMIALYAAENPRVIYNLPPEGSVTATRVFVYRGFSGAILAAFTPAYQKHPTNDGQLIYQTGWLERGEVFPMERIDAARALSELAARTMGAGWIWMDRAVLGKQVLPSKWKSDGLFHWYAYNWTASYYGNAQLFWRL
jgi:GNAT superfamily N-acetyltransferase